MNPMEETEWNDVPWRLAHRDTGAGQARVFSVSVDGTTVHLRRLGDGDWCACLGVCGRCGGALDVSTPGSDKPQMRCEASEASWPLVVGSEIALPCMVVDEEVYVLLGEDLV